jgi:LPS O-antigen subunit length determinant protein (WzzB/FepE family)
MDIQKKPLYEYHLVDLIKIFILFKKPIIITTCIGFLASVIVALLLPVYFRSTAFIYPNNLTLADKSMIFGQQQGQNEHSYYGNKYDANRILSIANSSVIAGYIIEKHQLAKHYGYDNEKFIWTKTVEEFQSNYSAFKNDRDAIEITIYDTDPQKAATMVNNIVDKIDAINSEPIIENKRKIIQMLKKQIDKKNLELKSTPKNSSILEELKNLNKSLTEYEVSANDKISTITILERAFPAEKKSKPTRSLIVIFSTLGALLIAFLVSLLSLQFRIINKNLKK